MVIITDEDIPELGGEDEETFGEVREVAPSVSFLRGLASEMPEGRRRRSSSADTMDGNGNQGKRVREEGSDLETMVRSVAQNLIVPLIQRQRTDMSEFGGQMVSALSAFKVPGAGDKKEDKLSEEPIMVDMNQFLDEKDDAMTTFAFGVRNALRPFNCRPKDYWKGLTRY